MRKPIIFLLIPLAFLIPIISGCSSPLSSSFTAFQRASLAELNYARTQPAAYARDRLASFKNAGTDYGAYDDLTGRPAVCPLKLQSQLCTAATDYAGVLATNNTFGHTVNDTTPVSRCAAAGYNTTYFSGENLAGNGVAECNADANPETAAIYFVRMLIIDEGQSDLGHRKIIMYSGSSTVGVGFCHKTPTDDTNNKNYINYCVQDFGLQ
jgi:uncharacterized protein YkwD